MKPRWSQRCGKENWPEPRWMCLLRNRCPPTTRYGNCPTSSSRRMSLPPPRKQVVGFICKRSATSSRSLMASVRRIRSTRSSCECGRTSPTSDYFCLLSPCWRDSTTNLSRIESMNRTPLPPPLPRWRGPKVKWDAGPTVRWDMIPALHWDRPMPPISPKGIDMNTLFKLVLNFLRWGEARFGTKAELIVASMTTEPMLTLVPDPLPASVATRAEGTAALADYTGAAQLASDGSKSAILDRDEKRAILEAILTGWAGHLELAAAKAGEINILGNSGYDL